MTGISDIFAERDSLQSDVDALELELSQAYDALAAERARVEEWRSEYQTASNVLNIYRDKNTKLIAALEDNRAKVDALEAEVERLREAGDDMANKAEHGFVSEGITTWDTARHAINGEPKE